MAVTIHRFSRWILVPIVCLDQRINPITNLISLKRKLKKSRRNRAYYQRRFGNVRQPSTIEGESSYSRNVIFADANKQGDIHSNEKSERPSTSSNPPFHRAGTRKSIGRRNYAIASNENHLPTSPHTLRSATKCSNCQAITFEREPKNFCCSQGTLLVKEQMLEPYVIAKDKLLIQNGKMFPTVGRILYFLLMLLNITFFNRLW